MNITRLIRRAIRRGCDTRASIIADVETRHCVSRVEIDKEIDWMFSEKLLDTRGDKIVFVSDPENEMPNTMIRARCTMCNETTYVDSDAVVEVNGEYVHICSACETRFDAFARGAA